MTGGKASEFRGRGLASGAWMGGRVRGRLKGHGVVRSGVNLDGVGVNPGESESSIEHAGVYIVGVFFLGNIGFI